MYIQSPHRKFLAYVFFLCTSNSDGDSIDKIGDPGHIRGGAGAGYDQHATP